MTYDFFVAIDGLYPCAYCRKITKQRPALRDSETAYPPCCLRCMHLDRALWKPLPVTVAEAAMISAFCDDTSRATADLQTTYAAIEKARGLDICNSFNGGQA
jgi:hypothetical protein